MQYVVLLLLGAAMCVVGVLNFRGVIPTLHVYNRQAVSEENRAKYRRLMGSGTLTAGISVAGAAVWQMIRETELAWWVLLAGVAAGAAIMLCAQFSAGGLFGHLQALIAHSRDHRSRRS